MEKKPEFETIRVIAAEVHEDLPESDIDELIETYKPEAHEAPICLGHPETDSPAYGWVKKLVKIGNQMFADIEVLPEMKTWLNLKLWKKRSIAFYRDFEKTGKLMLKHLGYLGATPPRIKGMPDGYFKEKKGEFQIIEFNEPEKQKNEKIKKEMTMSSLVTYSEEQYRVGVKDAVGKKEKDLIEIHKKEKATVVENFSEQITGLKKENEDLKKDKEALQKNNTEFAEKLKKSEIETFVTSLISEGKLAPANKAEEVEVFMELPERVKNKRMENWKTKKKIMEFGETQGLNEFERDSTNNGLTEEEKKVDFGLTNEDMKTYGGER